jgi:hypothetical protein
MFNEKSDNNGADAPSNTASQNLVILTSVTLVKIVVIKSFHNINVLDVISIKAYE